MERINIYKKIIKLNLIFTGHPVPWSYPLTAWRLNISDLIMSHILSAQSPKTVWRVCDRKSSTAATLSWHFLLVFLIFSSPIRRLHYRKNKITLLMCSVSQFLSEGAVRRRYRTDSPSIISFFSLSHTHTPFPFFYFRKVLSASSHHTLRFSWKQKKCVHPPIRSQGEFSKCQLQLLYYEVTIF